MNPFFSSLQRDETLVVLLLALPFQELIISTTALLRICPADRRAMLIGSTPPFVLIQKSTGAFEYVILAVSQNTVFVILNVLREFHFGCFIAQFETFRQALDVAFCDDNPFVRAAISRALVTIVKDAQFFGFCRVAF